MWIYVRLSFIASRSGDLETSTETYIRCEYIYTRKYTKPEWKTAVLCSFGAIPQKRRFVTFPSLSIDGEYTVKYLLLVCSCVWSSRETMAMSFRSSFSRERKRLLWLKDRKKKKYKSVWVRACVSVCMRAYLHACVPARACARDGDRVNQPFT